MIINSKSLNRCLFWTRSEESLFFRRMVGDHLDPAYEEREPDWCSQLKKRKMNNASVLALDVEWSQGSTASAPKIVNAQFILGGRFKGAEEEADIDDVDPDLDVSPSPGASKQTSSTFIGRSSSSFRAFETPTDAPQSWLQRMLCGCI